MPRIYDNNFIEEELTLLTCMHVQVMYEITVHNPIETITAQLMEHFRSSFPDCSVTLKMHMLEERTVPWAKRTYVRFGLLRSKEQNPSMPGLTPCIRYMTQSKDCP